MSGTARGAATVTAVARPRLSPLLAPLALGGGAVLGSAVLGTFSPHEPGIYPTCPSLMLTGFYCPGCGTLRAIHDLWNLDLLGAWSMNPLALVLLPFVLGSWVAWVQRAATGRPRRYLSAPWVPKLLLVVTLAYWVLRNIPVLEPYLAP